MEKSENSFDVVIIGGGPTGLAFAVNLAQHNTRVCVIEKEPQAVLKSPAADGREIALTHASIDQLKKLGIFEHIPANEITPIAEAKVIDGSSQTYFLNFSPDRVKRAALGFIVSNNLIRKAAYTVAYAHPYINLVAGVEVAAVTTHEAHGDVKLSDGRVFRAPLIVAADGAVFTEPEAYGHCGFQQGFLGAPLLWRG